MQRCGSCGSPVDGVRKPRPWAKNPQTVHRDLRRVFRQAVHRPRCEEPGSAQLLLESLEGTVEVGGRSARLLDLVDRVHDRGVVLVVEQLTYLRVREGG